MVYIFGGSGFLGQHLCNKFNDEHIDFTVCDIIRKNAEYKFIQVDISKQSELKNINFDENDIIVNLAANQYHGKVPRKYRKEYFFNVNTVGLQNILEHMDKCGCKNLIMFSTDMVYGKPQYLPVDTNHVRNPFGYYGQSKKYAEDLCFEYRKKGFNITIFRPRMIIGPGRLGILKKLFKLIEFNLPVPTIGNGNNHYQMISVFDCVSAIMCALDKKIPNREYNLGSKNPPTVRNLLSQFINNSNSKSFVFKTNGKLVKLVLKVLAFIGLEIMYKEQYMIADENYILDISLTENELGWSPQYSDEKMLNEAYLSYSRRK